MGVPKWNRELSGLDDCKIGGAFSLKCHTDVRGKTGFREKMAIGKQKDSTHLACDITCAVASD